MMTGDDEILVAARRALLDALDALDDHNDAVVVVGAQAIHLRTGNLKLALAEATKDADLGLDARRLNDDPLIEDALKRAGFVRPPGRLQPGAWMTPSGMPVDIMVPEEQAGQGRRSVELPPHHKDSMRRAAGLEAAVVDNEEMEIAALDPDDGRRVNVRVAGCAALVVAKAHKVGERLRDQPERAQAKDAHDLYRLLVATDTAPLRATLDMLRQDDLAGQATTEALDYLEEWFSEADRHGALLAGEAEAGVGDPEQVSIATAVLVSDLLDALDGDD